MSVFSEEVAKLSGGTISAPSRDSSMRSVSAQLHKLVLKAATSPSVAGSMASSIAEPDVVIAPHRQMEVSTIDKLNAACFDMHHFVRQTFLVASTVTPRVHASCVFFQKEEHRPLPVPSTGASKIMRTHIHTHKRGIHSLHMSDHACQGLPRVCRVAARSCMCVCVHVRACACMRACVRE
jgi:hypothetical protein